MRNGVVRCVVVILAAAGILAGPGRADAGFMANTLSYEYLTPTVGTVTNSSTFVVTGGVERSSLFNGNTGTDVANFDVSDNSVLVQFYATGSWTPAFFNGFHLSDISNTIPAITGVTANSATNMSGFGTGNVSFDANNIFVNWESLSFTNDPPTVVQLDVTFAGGSVATPLPPTLLAGFLGMGLLAGVRRFRRA